MHLVNGEIWLPWTVRRQFWVDKHFYFSHLQWWGLFSLRAYRAAFHGEREWIFPFNFATQLPAQKRCNSLSESRQKTLLESSSSHGEPTNGTPNFIPKWEIMLPFLPKKLESSGSASFTVMLFKFRTKDITYSGNLLTSPQLTEVLISLIFF